MKKTRILACIAVVGLLCLCLCGCNLDLDELRANHGIWDGDNIVLNNAVYKPLPACEELSPTMLSPSYDEHYIYVTENDVPLLLASDYGDRFIADEAHIFICKEIHRDETNPTYYCHEDHYEEVLSKINAGPVLSNYCYEYTTMDRETYNYYSSTYRLTPEEANAVDTVLSTVIGQTLQADHMYSYDHAVSLMYCSGNLWFKSPAYIEVKCIDDLYYLQKNPLIGRSVVYPVPSEWNTQFSSLLKAAKEADEAMNEYYGEW